MKLETERVKAKGTGFTTLIKYRGELVSIKDLAEMDHIKKLGLNYLVLYNRLRKPKPPETIEKFLEPPRQYRNKQGDDVRYLSKEVREALASGSNKRLFEAMK